MFSSHSLRRFLKRANGVTIPPFAPGETSSIAVGDFDGDGKLDLIVANTLEGDPQSVFELRGNGDGTFQSPINLRFSASVASRPVASPTVTEAFVVADMWYLDDA